MRNRPQVFRRLLLVPLVGILLALAGLTMINSRYDFFRQPAYTMAPALPMGRTVVVDTADRSRPNRGDIVLLDRGRWPGEPDGGKSLLRVAGLPGDKLSCCDDRAALEVNGTRIGPMAPAATAPFESTVPAGRVFVTGDNSELAKDSRFFVSEQSGTLPLDAVKGRAVGTILPVGDAGALNGASMTYFYLMALITGIGVLTFLVGAAAAWMRRPRQYVESQPQVS
ncbi:signal peptidase I [Micromonospora aurantiaca (nom. illeg.)]|uniref:Signal peptidase I n=1 Tax=Micromonospora aurantiaca (nom. illeg.) TaxID=47850 RepID=A0A6N3K5N0_9ACTN|nr:signal peptidase I [Micromonospora aurantiaca]